MTQAEYILMMLQRDGYVTPLDAVVECNCFRLATRILELRAQGHEIEAQTRVLPGGKSIPVYSLKQHQQKVTPCQN